MNTYENTIDAIDEKILSLSLNSNNHRSLDKLIATIFMKIRENIHQFSNTPIFDWYQTQNTFMIPFVSVDNTKLMLATWSCAYIRTGRLVQEIPWPSRMAGISNDCCCCCCCGGDRITTTRKKVVASRNSSQQNEYEIRHDNT